MQNMMLAYSSKCYSVTGLDKITIFSTHIRNIQYTSFTEIFGIHGNVCSGYHGEESLETMSTAQ